MAKPGTPIKLMPQALGTYEWKVSTGNTEAQAFFNQGMQLRWAYNMPESVASMVRAGELDPSCAMCFWGEAFSRGSFLNGAMSAEQALAARIDIQQANQLKANSSAVERALIEAALVRYPEDYDPDERRLVDQAFADTMAEVYADFAI